MKEYATLIAVGGAVLLGAGVLILTGITKQTLDAELMKQLFAGLLGFAGGAGATYAVTK